MARTADLSPLGLFTWDNTIFDLMQIPPKLDRETLINSILAETSELEVLYPNPEVFKMLVGVWSAKNIDVWQRLYNTTQYEYNPIENYNRYEEGTTQHSGTQNRSGTNTTTGNTTMGGTDTGRTTSNSGHWIAGFDSQPSGNSDGLVKQTRDENTENNSVSYGRTGTSTESLTLGENTTHNNDGKHTLHAHGNIGVTTTQKLIKEQRSIDLFNPYDIIISDFKMKFCILVY